MRDVGTLGADQRNDSGGSYSSSYWYRMSVTSEYDDGTGTAYDEVPDWNTKEWEFSSYFKEEPQSPYDTTTYSERVWYYIEPQDGSSEYTKGINWEPDDSDGGDGVSFSMSVGPSMGLGWVDAGVTLGQSQSWDTTEVDDTYQDNQYWYKFRIDRNSFPSSSSDSPDNMEGGWIAVTTTAPNTYPDVRARSKYLFSYTCPGSTVPCTENTDVLSDTFEYIPVTR